MTIQWGYHQFSVFTSSLEVHIYCTLYTHIQGHFHYSQLVSCSYCICYFAPSLVPFLSFHKCCWGPAAKSQSLQGSSTAFEGMDHSLKTRSCSGLFLRERAKVHKTADHCTITRRSQCLTPHHLETLARSLTRDRNCSSVQFVRSSPSQDRLLLHVWFGTSSFHICALYPVFGDLKPHTGGFLYIVAHKTSYVSVGFTVTVKFKKWLNSLFASFVVAKSLSATLQIKSMFFDSLLLKLQSANFTHQAQPGVFGAY